MMEISYDLTKQNMTTTSKHNLEEDMQEERLMLAFELKWPEKKRKY